MITKEDVLRVMADMTDIDPHGVVWHVELGSEVECGQPTGWGYAYETIEFPGLPRALSKNWWFVYADL